MNIRNHLHIAVYAILIIASFSSAQIKIHRTLTTEDGLAQGQLASMLQDSKGYIWFGTFDGVSRWDGINFENIQTHNGMPASQIMDIEEGNDSSIYIAAYGGGVLVYKDGKLDTINTNRGLVTNNITQVISLRDGSILFAGDDGNISKLESGKLKNWSEAVGFPENDIFGIYESEDGKIYFATENGLLILEKKSLTTITTEHGLHTNYLWSVSGDENGTIYIGTNRGINKLADGKISSVNFRGKPFRNAVFKIHISREGKVYYASNVGILIENSGNTELLTVDNGLVFNDNWSLLEDDTGLLYFGSNGEGVSVYDPKERFINYSIILGSQQESISSIKEAEIGTYFFGTKSGLLRHMNDEFKLFTTREGRRSNIIEVLHISMDSNILLGTKDGLKIFHEESIKPYINNPDLLNNEIYSIAETKSGRLFVGTRNGIFSIDEKKVERLEYFDNYSSIYVISILATENEGVFFGSFDKGVFIYKDDKYNTITNKQGLSTNRVNCFHKREDGTILIGTQSGLNIFKDGIIIDTIDVNDGLNNNVIADINEDDKGQIFLSTYKGLNIVQNLNGSISVRYLTHEDGLINNNCIIGASYLDVSGHLWLGTQSGITRYNPHSDEVITTPPRIFLTGIEIFNEDYPIKELEKTNSLSYNQNYLKFRFTGINLTAPEKIVYEYKLSNVDKKWIRTTENSVQYTSLGSGDYVFEVKAQNEWGFWSQPAALSFTINPVWWKTWWFTILIGIIFLGGVFLVFNRRLRSLEKETKSQKEFSNRLIQSQEEERKRIAAGIHDSLGQNLLIIKNRALLGMKHKEQEFLKEQLSEISATASSTLDEVRHIAYNLHPYQLNRLGLTKAIRSIITNVKDSTSINFRDNLENIDSLIEKKDEINIYRIVQENINNIVKHSEAENASIKISKNDSSISIFIEDDGKGFNADDYNDSKKLKGFGLENIKKRVNLLNGELSINSNNGTSVVIIIPIKR